jgi:hypothetical protein
MKLQLKNLVKTPAGKSIKIDVIDDGKPIERELTVKLVLESALSMPMEEDLRHGTQRFIKLGDMLKALADAKDDIELTSEQITLIKERVPQCFRGNPQIVWGALQACEGAWNDAPKAIKGK